MIPHLHPEQFNLIKLMPSIPQPQTELAQAIFPVLVANLATLDRKQQDYGSANLIKFGTFGVVVRMNDKMERIVNLMEKMRKSPGEAIINNESIGDSFLDLANYALIAYVMHTKKWPMDVAIGHAIGISRSTIGVTQHRDPDSIDVTQHNSPAPKQAKPLHPSSPYPRHDEIATD